MFVEHPIPNHEREEAIGKLIPGLDSPAEENNATPFRKFMMFSRGRKIIFVSKDPAVSGARFCTVNITDEGEGKHGLFSEAIGKIPGVPFTGDELALHHGLGGELAVSWTDGAVRNYLFAV